MAQCCEWPRGKKNDAVKSDDVDKSPPCTSGVNIVVDVSHSNIDLATGRAVPRNERARPRNPHKEAGTWTGAGKQTIWVKFREGDVLTGVPCC